MGGKKDVVEVVGSFGVGREIGDYMVFELVSRGCENVSVWRLWN